MIQGLLYHSCNRNARIFTLAPILLAIAGFSCETYLYRYFSADDNIWINYCFIWIY